MDVVRRKRQTLERGLVSGNKVVFKHRYLQIFLFRLIYLLRTLNHPRRSIPSLSSHCIFAGQTPLTRSCWLFWSAISRSYVVLKDRYFKILLRNLSFTSFEHMVWFLINWRPALRPIIDFFHVLVIASFGILFKWLLSGQVEYFGLFQLIFRSFEWGIRFGSDRWFLFVDIHTRRRYNNTLSLSEIGLTSFFLDNKLFTNSHCWLFDRFLARSAEMLGSRLSTFFKHVLVK